MIKVEAQKILDKALGIYSIATDSTGNFVKKTLDIDLVEHNSNIYNQLLSKRKALKKDIDKFGKDCKKTLKNYFFSCLDYDNKDFIDKTSLSIINYSKRHIGLKLSNAFGCSKSTFYLRNDNRFEDIKVYCDTQAQEDNIFFMLFEVEKKINFEKLHSICQLSDSEAIEDEKKFLNEINELIYYIENKYYFSIVDKLFIPHNIKDIEKAFEEAVENLLNKRSADWFYTVDIKLWKNHIKVNTYKFNVRIDRGARVYTLNGNTVSKKEAFEIFSRQRSYFYNVKKLPIIRKSFPINEIESKLNQQIKQLNISNF